MLKGPYDRICVKTDDTLKNASLNIEKLFELHLELISVLAFLNKNDINFEKWHENNIGLTLKDMCNVFKNMSLPCLNSLNCDLNVYKQKLGCYEKRKDNLEFKVIDIPNNTFLGFINSGYISRESKFLSLSAYFKMKLDSIRILTDKISENWKDDQFFEYKYRLNSTAEFSVDKYAQIFKEYSKYISKNEKEKLF